MFDPFFYLAPLSYTSLPFTATSWGLQMHQALCHYLWHTSQKAHLRAIIPSRKGVNSVHQILWKRKRKRVSRNQLALCQKREGLTVISCWYVFYSDAPTFG